MSDLVWSEALALGLDWLDADHREAVDHIAAMIKSDDAGFAEAFAAFAQHLHEHFAREEAMMARSGFPAMHCHEAEHRRVLDLVADLGAQIAAGEPDAARAFARNGAAAWFVQHRDTMDYVTVNYARQAGVAG